MSPKQRRLAALREREATLRNRLAPAEQPPWIDVSGADPYRIVPLRDGRGFAGILRGSRALVLLTPELSEMARVRLAEAPTALCTTSGGVALVGSRFASSVARFALSDGHLQRLSDFTGVLPGGIADLSCDSDERSYVLPADGSPLMVLDRRGRVLSRYPSSRGGLRLLKRGHYLLESSLHQRSLRILRLDANGLPNREVSRIQHQGPIWGFAALERGTELLLAVSGAEEKPLVRAHGEFENIDSFLWLYRLGERLELLSSLNVSDRGLVVPKVVSLRPVSGGVSLTALAAGSGWMLEARYGDDLKVPTSISLEPIPPGASDAASELAGAGFVFADPLFDAWVRVDHGTRLARVDPRSSPDPELRLGEALFFTELIAPDNPSTGSHSRFSCETCHFEGGVDGRVHYTGRRDVSVVTKPLFGLANNRPHFSRALDPDLSSVCHNEFRVAGAGSGQDPWFTLSASRFPWLQQLGVRSSELDPLALRTALMKFLYGFSPAPNPLAQERRHFSELERRGAREFLQHCSACHAARLVSDQPQSAILPDAWEESVLSRNGPIVWARGEYEKTGILPYVHERGTRITSLRRLELKPRYFSNGSSPDLQDVLDRFREGPAGAWHAAPAAAGLAPLPEATRAALLAFLRLL